jgi:TolB protein
VTVVAVATIAGFALAVGLAGTWWSQKAAAPAGRPGLLVAARQGELLLLDPAGSVVRRIPTGELYGFGAWSDDGSRLAYADGTQQRPDLVVLDAKLTETLRIRLPEYAVPLFSWSPDGRRIAFSRETAAYAQVFVVDVAPGAVAVPITDPEVSARAPRWSPDGQWIAVRGGVDLPDQALYAMHPDGSALTLLSRRARPVDAFCGGWTPDSQAVVFGTRGNGSATWIVDRDGMNERMLTSASAGASCPALSPDGGRIAVAVSNDRGRSMAVMRLDGSGLVTPNGPVWDTWPGVWSPDGRAVVVNGRAPGDLPDPRAFLDPDAQAAGRTFFDDNAYVVDWQRLPS